MMLRIIVLLSLLVGQSLQLDFIPYRQPRILRWKGRLYFADENNWSKGRTPCNGDTIKFPEGEEQHVVLSHDLVISNMILSEHTTISFDPSNVSISVTGQPDTRCPGEEIRFLSQNIADAGRWLPNLHPFSLLQNEQAPCKGDQLRLTYPEDMLLLNQLSPITLNSIQPYMGADIISSTSALETFRQTVERNLGLDLKIDGITFSTGACDVGCNCVVENMHKYPSVCRSITCPLPVHPCSKFMVPYGQCCSACALVYVYRMLPECTPFEKFFNRVGAAIVQHPKLEEYKRKGNVSISYIGNLKAQVTFTTDGDEQVLNAGEIMASLPPESDCYKLEEWQSSVALPDYNKTTNPGSTLGVSLFFLFFFSILLIFAYVMRHSIKSRYIPQVVEVVGGMVRSMRGGQAGSMEMRGAVIFDNASVFDANVASLHEQQHSFGNDEENIVDKDFLNPIPSPSKQVSKTPKRRKRHNKKDDSAFSNPAFDVNKVATTKQVEKTGETSDEKKEEEKDGNEKEEDRKDRKKREKKESESFENPFFSI